MKNKLTPFSKRTAESIYLEYVNDWLTLAAMAENYNRPIKELQYIIEKGKIENNPAEIVFFDNKP